MRSFLCTVMRAFLLLGACATAAGRELIRGISYGPVPLKSEEGAAQLPQDDWMCDEAVTMWGRSGRGDLRIMREMGANMVRLYGNNPENDHGNFLDTAHKEGLFVAAGMSDYPYYQMPVGNCKTTGFNCFKQVKSLYAQNLAKGFLTAAGRYHPALKYMNILNEPDLKVPPTATNGGPEGPKQMGRALISAFDAMLDAEKEANVTGPLINFTATFSYAICPSCTYHSDRPALGQIAQLQDAMLHPEKYGYKPKHDISAAYKARFTHSFNTANPATDLRYQFLDAYSASFPTTPVYIGEYHRVHGDQLSDLSLILDIAANNNLFLGISFFQYQVAYWKAGTERDFGMFGLSNAKIASMAYASKNYGVFCLAKQPSPESGMPMPDAVAEVYGGRKIDTDALCVPNPWGVNISQDGYAAIAAQDDARQTKRFVERVVEHLGAVVSTSNLRGLKAFVAKYTGSGKTFAAMASELGSRPAWMQVDPKARCVADRGAPPSAVVKAIEWTCTNAKSFSCDDVPASCQGSAYKTGDYIFSRFYQELGADANPLVSCSFGGAAQFAASAIYMRANKAQLCVEGATNLEPVTSAPSAAMPHHRDIHTSHGATTTATTTPDAKHEDVQSGETTTTTIIEEEYYWNQVSATSGPSPLQALAAALLLTTASSLLRL